MMPQAPVRYGSEVGELKGMGSNLLRLIDYQPLLKVNGKVTTEAAVYVSNDYEPYEPESLTDHLKHVAGFAIIEAPTYGHSIIDAPGNRRHVSELPARLITPAFQPANTTS